MTAAVDFGTATDVGRVRDLNEDALLAQPPLFAVADGMGGHAAGEVASDLALTTIRPLAAQPAISQGDILGAIDRANAAILERSVQEGETRGMGTTLAGLCLGQVGGSLHWFVFNVGDSRVYRYSASALEQLTTDHSEVEELVAAGHLTPDEARVHPNRNVITRSLGMEPAPIADMWVIPAQRNETYVVCSDGLTTEIDDDEIRQVLSFGWSAQMAADELCQRAVMAGGRDNVSVVVVQLGGEFGSDIDVSTAPRSHAIEEDE